MIISGWPDAISCYDGLSSMKDYVWYISEYETGGSVVYSIGTGFTALEFDETTGDLVTPIDCTETNISEFVQANFGGGGSNSPYTIDIGSSVMLGGILAFLIAHWLVGLARFKNNR